MPGRGLHGSGNEQPLVSVIVPAFNAENTILQTLQSAAAQTYPSLEIVIIDDGSTDRTRAIASEFCAAERRARVVGQQNAGLSAARNRGVRESSGPWIAPLDADDLWHPTKIEKQVKAALAAPEEPGFVYCLYQDIDEQGFIIGSSPPWAFAGAALKRLTYHNTIHTLLLSRKAIDRVGGYDEGLRACEDTMIQLAIARHYPVAVVREHLLGYRKRPGSMSRDTDLVIASWRGVIRRHAADGADLPPALMRQMEGLHSKILAEDRASKGAYAEALVHFSRALAHDPLRWGGYAGYRLLRTAVRLARRRRPRSRRLLFSEADPCTFVPADPDALGAIAGWLDRQEERRLRRLERDEALEPLPAGSRVKRSPGYPQG